jgi:TonB family protein
MDATVPGGAGGLALPATPGRTAARGDPTLPRSAPVGDAPAGAAPVYADATEVEIAPRVVRQPSGAELRALYPEQARRDGIEGDVRLELLVNERGSVERVRVVERAGHGFDEVAEQLRPQFRFFPAARGGRAVSVWIPWTLKFRLDR